MAAYQLGFIGTGNMGGALVEAVCKVVDPATVLLSNRTRAKAQALANRFGCHVGTNEEVAAQCAYIFLGVKPQMMADTLAPLRETLLFRKEPFVLVSMAAGLTMEKIAGLAGGSFPIIRIMPNTPCAVGAGLTNYTANAAVSPEALERFLHYMSASGTLDPLDESLIEAATAIAGCGGAYILQIMEALADGGVACGLPRAKALLYAAKMIEGTGKLALESGLHPGVLKDQVCSPGGSTIQGVRVLEERGVRGAVMDAVIAACQRGKELG